MNGEAIKLILELCKNPLFKDAFAEFFIKMQQDGTEAARKYYWDAYPNKDKSWGNTTDIFEQMIEFYSNLGFVSRKKYEDSLQESERLKKENEFLKKTLKELNVKVFAEEGRKTQEVWNKTIEKQMEMSKEISKNFLDIFKK